MLPYFHKLSAQLLSDVAKSHMANLAMENFPSFKHVTFHKDFKDHQRGLYYTMDSNVFTYPEVKTLIDSCTVTPDIIFIMLTPPNYEVGPHCDEYSKRNTVLSIPLYPVNKFACTNFYTNFTSSTPHCTVTYEEGLPVLLNTNKIHGLPHTDEFRITLQLGFERQIEELAELWDSGKLFKSQ
jgi:hypothetical protein